MSDFDFSRPTGNKNSGFTGRSVFDSLGEEYRKLLVSLPYRVGYWISQSDRTGGEESDRMELDALECMIISYAQDMCKSEFMQCLMEETVSHKDEWDLWKKDIYSVPEECCKACIALADNLDDKELKALQENLFEIAFSVANIYQEENISFGRRIRRLKDCYANRVRKFFGWPYEEEFMYSFKISLHERAALRKLKEMLGI
jgi:hypothetical protein